MPRDTQEEKLSPVTPAVWGSLIERIDIDQHAATVVFRGGIGG